MLAPFIKDQKGEHKVIFEQIKKAGFARVRVDGTVMDLNEAQNMNLDKQKKHTIDVVVDRLTISPEDKGRMSESLEKALDLGDGIAMATRMDTDEKTANTKKILSCPKNLPARTATCRFVRTGSARFFF